MMRICLILLSFFLTGNLAGQSTIYVNINATGLENGTSWIDAYTDLQDAIDFASESDQIWVSQGTYIPSRDSSGIIAPADLREKMFFVQKDIKIYGGFLGNEMQLSERDFRNNTTVLSGVIGNSGTESDSVYHVFFIKGRSGSAIISNDFLLDGFTITGGRANQISEINRQDRGAGLYIDAEGSGNEAAPTIRNCTFTGNHSYLGGAGMLASGIDAGLAFPLIFNCNFEDNYSSITGSALWVDGRLGRADIKVYNSRFYNNNGDNGIYRAAIAGRPDGGEVDIELTNCTIAGNSPAGILAYDNRPNNQEKFYDLRLNNTILYDNGIEIMTFGSYNQFFQSSSIGVDPPFADLAAGNLRLDDCSGLINAGDNNLNPTDSDLDGESRIKNALIDLGSYESNINPMRGSRLYVDIDATGCNNGMTWVDAYVNLQSAINVSEPGDSIWVSEGTYIPTEDINGVNGSIDPRNKTFYINKNIKLFGGFNGTEVSFSQRDIKTNETNLSGKLMNGDSSYHVVYIRGLSGANAITTECVLDGFSIRDGRADVNQMNIDNRGGGLVIVARGNVGGDPNMASPTIRNCSFYDNIATLGGGGICADGTSGGLAAPEIISCVFERNIADNVGSAFWDDARFGGNTDSKIVNSRFYKNTVTTNAGGAAIHGSGIVVMKITNTTIASNGRMGVRVSEGSSELTINNTVVYDHTIDVQSSLSVTYNLNNSVVSADPVFVDLASGDLRLDECSPLINAGDDALINLSEDLDGNLRIQNGNVDIGCYESSFDPVIFPNSRIYVDINAIGTCETGGSWESAFKDLQSALDFANKGDSIWVAKGTYIPTKDISGNESPIDPRKKTLFIDKDIRIFGGFSGTETALSERNFRSNETILSGIIGSSGTDADSVYHVVYVRGLTDENRISNNCEIDGFTITGGRANVNQQNIDDRGAGIILVARGNLAGVPNEVSPIIRNCNFRGNFSTLGGGGILADATSKGLSEPIIQSCNFENNESVAFGSGFWADARFEGNVNTVIENSRFYNNKGSGAFNNAAIAGSQFGGTLSISLTNCTVAHNNEKGLYIDGSESTAVLNNTIIFGHEVETLIGNTSSLTLFSSVVGEDPFFINILNGDLRLKACSPFINNGDNTKTSVLKDLDGADRILESTVDLGCYEQIAVPPPALGSIIFVDIDADGCKTGSNWEHAFTDLQDALNAATESQEIWVADGTYFPTQNRLGAGNMDERNKSFIIRSDLKIYGGFNGTESNRSQRDPSSNECVLDGDLERTDGRQSYHTVYIDGRIKDEGISEAMILDGFSIRGGSSDMATTKYNGAGIYIDASFSMCNPTIENCIIQNNYSNSSGGGIYINALYGMAFPRIYNCIFKNNTANLGGAIFNDATFGEARPDIINCLFTDNTVINMGTTQRGAVVYNFGNEGEASSNIVNATIVGNTSGNQGAVYSAVFGDGDSQPTISNTIFWNNGIDIINSGGAQTTENNNLKDLDPLFTGPSDYTLLPLSPAINGGINAPNPLPNDLQGNARVVNGFIDIGAYESQDDCGPLIPGVIFVDASATGSSNGTCWKDAFTKISDALNVATSGNQIFIARGIYTDAETTSNIMHRVEKDIPMYGSFVGGERHPDQRSENILGSDMTVIDGSNGGSPYNFAITSDTGPGVYTFDGFVVKNAKRALFYTGGNGTTHYIRNCIFEDNSIEGAAAFSFFNDSQINIENCIFRNNKSFRGGGALDFNNNSPSVTFSISECLFENNLSNPFNLQSLPIAVSGVENGSVNIEACEFLCNSFYSGLPVGGSGTEPFSTIRTTISNCSFNNTCNIQQGFPSIHVEVGTVIVGENVILNE